jgi:tRNA (guanine-N7-)-methyltransferase
MLSVHPMSASAPQSCSPDDIQWIPASILEPVKLEALFPSKAPVTVDYGCGEGAFVLAMAEKHPDQNFLATERLVGRVEKVCKTAARKGLRNIRVLRLENLYTARFILPAQSVATSYVSFPDPWPKRAHQNRRLVQPEFLKAVHATLVDGGELRLKTDDLPYFRWMEKVIAESTGRERLDWEDDAQLPLTNFEARFIAQGLPIHKTILRKIQPA